MILQRIKELIAANVVPANGRITSGGWIFGEDSGYDVVVESGAEAVLLIADDTSLCDVNIDIAKGATLRILNIIKEKEEVDFEELFAGDATVPEIVTTFQALLELLKHQFVTVEQSELFSKITIKKNPNKGEEEEIGKIDEYN